MSAPAIQADRLSKRYRLQPGSGRRFRYGNLRETLVDLALAPIRRLFRGETPASEEVWALKDVSFEVKSGEVLGIVGRNGAGKSTLLKVLARITEPTAGRALIRGRVGSLLEVGTGFHPELTGRENVFLNGAVLGMRRREIERKFDEIVAFAEVGKFIDTPVKQYSTGMYMRLAFAVAAHLEPDILLVDEVLAVGDAAFQRKCLGKMSEVAGTGRTVLFVSHNMSAVRSLCPRAIWIEAGGIAADGRSDEVVSRYLQAVSEGFAEPGGRRGHERVAIERVVLRNSRGEPTLEIAPAEDLTVEVHYRAKERIEKPYFWVYVVSQHGPLFVASMLFDGRRPPAMEGTGVLTCTFKAPPLLPQMYTIRVGARSPDGMTSLLESREVAFFNVSGRLADVGLEGEIADMIAWDSTSLILPYEWKFPDGEVVQVRMRGS